MDHGSKRSRFFRCTSFSFELTSSSPSLLPSLFRFLETDLLLLVFFHPSLSSSEDLP